jgi:hypothetical protein
VRVIAAIPAIALLAGAAAGLLLPDAPVVFACLVLASTLAFAVVGWMLQRPRLLSVSVAVGFFVGGGLLSSVESRRAERPTLRVAFEELARVAREHAIAEGRRMPEDDEAFAVVEGVLRADAAQMASGVSLSVAVDRIVGQDQMEAPAATPSRGHGNPRRGVSVSVRRGWGPGAIAKR